MVNIRYQLTEADYAGFVTFIRWDAPFNKKKRWTFLLRQLLPLTAFLVVFLSMGYLRLGNTLTLVVLGFIGLSVLGNIFSARANIVKQAEKIAAEPGNESIFELTELTANATGLQIRKPEVVMQFNWKAFVSQSENDLYYFLFYNNLNAIIIPKRAFTTTDARQAFSQLLLEHLSLDAAVAPTSV